MQSDYVISLEYDPYGGVLVGTAFGLERFTNGQGQSVSQNGRFDPRVFYDTDSDSNSIWAPTDRGLCRYTWQFQRDDCWDDGDDVPDDARSVRIISPTRVLVGTENGAAVWDVTNEEVIEVWEAGENRPTMQKLWFTTMLHMWASMEQEFNAMTLLIVNG